MTYKVVLRKNDTGEERQWVSTPEIPWTEASKFFWTEGNYGCDCNRHKEFLRAGGAGPAHDPHWNDADHDCGYTAYSALRAILSDGRVIQLDKH